MVDRASFTTYDYDSERSGFSINIAEITAANLDDTVTAVEALRTATNAITLADIAKSEVSDTLWDNLTPVTNQFAQREIKWAVVVVDASNNKYKATEVPTADLAALANGSKYIVKGGVVVAAAGYNAAVTAWVAAYEAAALSNSGEALVVWDMFQVGRNT